MSWNDPNALGILSFCDTVKSLTCPSCSSLCTHEWLHSPSCIRIPCRRACWWGRHSHTDGSQTQGGARGHLWNTNMQFTDHRSGILTVFTYNCKFKDFIQVHQRRQQTPVTWKFVVSDCYFMNKHILSWQLQSCCSQMFGLQSVWAVSESCTWCERGLGDLVVQLQVQGPLSQLLQVACCGPAETLHGQWDVLLPDEQSFHHTLGSIQ